VYRILAASLALVACDKQATTSMSSVPPKAELFVQGEAGPEPVTIAELREDPEAWRGQRLDGRVMVQRTVTQRGFWMANALGESLFAIVRNEPENPDIDLDHGQELALRRALVQLPGDLDRALAPNDNTLRTAQSEPVHLLLGESDVTVVDKTPLYDAP